jgi:exodeoxyribonuclease VII large subunit
MRRKLAHETAGLDQLSAKLDALSPVKILDRGYALIFNSKGDLVKDVAQLSPGSKISGRVSRGSFTAEIKHTKSP